MIISSINSFWWMVSSRGARLLWLRLLADDRPVAGSRFRQQGMWWCIAVHQGRTRRLFRVQRGSRFLCRHFWPQLFLSLTLRRWSRNCESTKLWISQLKSFSFWTHAKLYPPMPMLSDSYLVIWAFFESSRGAAKEAAMRPTRTMNCFGEEIDKHLDIFALFILHNFIWHEYKIASFTRLFVT